MPGQIILELLSTSHASEETSALYKLWFSMQPILMQRTLIATLLAIFALNMDIDIA